MKCGICGSEAKKEYIERGKADFYGYIEGLPTKTDTHYYCTNDCCNATSYNHGLLWNNTDLQMATEKQLYKIKYLFSDLSYKTNGWYEDLCYYWVEDGRKYKGIVKITKSNASKLIVWLSKYKDFSELEKELVEWLDNGILIQRIRDKYGVDIYTLKDYLHSQVFTK